MSSPPVPKFGDWDMGGENGGQQSFTLIFDNMHATKSTKNMNPNDPEFLAEYFKSSSSSSPPLQAVVQDADSAASRPSVQKSPPRPVSSASKLSTDQKKHSPYVPKFGDWDGNGESGGQQSYTVIFDNMRVDKSMKNFNPNDPEFFAESFKTSSSSSEAVVNETNSGAPTPMRHESPLRPLQPSSKLSVNQKIQSPHVPKFGDWDAEGKDGEEQQPFTIIFDNIRADKNTKRVNPNTPAFIADSLNPSSSSSSPSPASIDGVNQQRPLPSQHDNRRPPPKSSSRGSMNHKTVLAPKFGNWDVEYPAEYTAIFDDLKEEKKHRHASTHHGTKTSTSPTTPLPTHKFSSLNWRLCFRSSSHAVRD